MTSPEASARARAWIALHDAGVCAPTIWRGIEELIRQRDAARAVLDERYPCDGLCTDAPEEDCSRHGRTPAELWEFLNAAATELAALRPLIDYDNERVDQAQHGEQVALRQVAAVRTMLVHAEAFAVEHGAPLSAAVIRTSDVRAALDDAVPPASPYYDGDCPRCWWGNPQKDCGCRTRCVSAVCAALDVTVPPPAASPQARSKALFLAAALTDEGEVDWQSCASTLSAQVAAVRALIGDLFGICDWHAGLIPPRHPREESVRAVAGKILEALDGAPPAAGAE